MKSRTALTNDLLLVAHRIHMPIKKRSHKEWRDLIRAELKGLGRNRHCSATCPICFISYDVDMLSSDISTRALAVGKVASHITSAHADALSDSGYSRRVASLERTMRVSGRAAVDIARVIAPLLSTLGVAMWRAKRAECQAAASLFACIETVKM